MRVAWALVVSWCMVVATTASPTRDAHRAGVSTASVAPHHVVRHRAAIAPFVAPDRVAIVDAPRVLAIASAIVPAFATDVTLVPAVARGPPAG